MGKKVRVMAVDNSIDMCEMLEVLVKSDPLLEWVGYADDGILALEQIGILNPDVILLDIVMPRLNGIAFLKQMVTMYPDNRPKVIILSSVSDQDLIRNVARLGVDYFLVKPVDIALVIKRIKQIAGLTSLPDTDKDSESVSILEEPEEEIETHVARLLFELRVPAYFKGYSYLKDAICMAVRDSNACIPITTTLYTKIAQKHGTTPPVVEAAIRYAIQQTWKRGDTKRLRKLFGPFSDAGKERAPTNSLFIARVAEEIKINPLY